MVVTEESEAQKSQREHNEQLESLDLYAVDELIDTVRDAHAYGYDFVNLAQIERGVVALAALQGFTGKLNAEEALLLLVERGEKFSSKVQELEKSAEGLEERLAKANTDLAAAKESIAELEQRPAGEPIDAVFIEQQHRLGTSEVLKAASEVLTKVPGQRSLAQRAIHSAHRLNELEQKSVVIVED